MTEANGTKSHAELAAEKFYPYQPLGGTVEITENDVKVINGQREYLLFYITEAIDAETKEIRDRHDCMAAFIAAIESEYGLLDEDDSNPDWLIDGAKRWEEKK